MSKAGSSLAAVISACRRRLVPSVSVRQAWNSMTAKPASVRQPPPSSYLFYMYLFVYCCYCHFVHETEAAELCCIHR